MWEFDSKTAKIYDNHVRIHIPNYETVINLVVDICNKLCKKDDAIVDFGSATGYTINQLAKNKFTNLTGVESSLDMINYCNKKNADFYSTLPNKKYKAIIANWSLHFNKNKKDLIEVFYNSLEDFGFLIISEKTIQNDFVKENYYQLKQNNGATLEEITEKEKLLVGVMYVDSLSWYYNELEKLNFKSIDIIDAKWGFVTLIAFKN